jgi:hypothetical protein
MNESQRGALGTATTVGGTFVAWLPHINLIVQIVAGVVAIVVGLATLRYYCRKLALLNKRDDE